MYQTAIENFTGRKINEMVIKNANIFHSKTLQTFTQIGIFGLKINHLATLTHTRCSLIQEIPRSSLLGQEQAGEQDKGLKKNSQKL
jgi:hypothetical protein